MNSIAMPSLSCSALRSARICACTVTSRAVVGSSAIRSFGLIGERHGDHHALTLPARKLMREGTEPALRVADADFLEERKGALTGLAAFDALVQRQDLADLALDRVQAG